MLKREYEYSLLGNNTFGIDESCREFVEFSSVEELKEVLASLHEATQPQPLLIIGGGSNLLLTKHFEGTVLHSAIKGREVLLSEKRIMKTEKCLTASHTEDDEVLVRCGSGEVWDDVVAWTIERGYYGMENLSIIPGEVGASAVQNIGAYGAEAKDIIYKVEAVEVATGCEVEFMNADCEYGYRQSRFKKDWKDRYVIHHVTYRLSKTFTPRIEYGNIKAELAVLGISTPTALQVRNAIISIRNSKLPDPKVQGNAGSFFMNPIVPRSKYEALAVQYPGMPHYDVDADSVKIPAGWMIDQCGWKGRAMGSAAVHDKQALVLVNRGGAKGADIVALCDEVRRSVRERFGIDIYPEVNFV